MDFSTGLPIAEAGLGVDRAWFAGSRLGVAVARHGGIVEISWYGRQRLGREAMFKADPISAWTKLFRPVLVVDGVPWCLEFTATRLRHSGYESTCTVGGVRVAHELAVVGESILQRMRILDRPVGAEVRLRLVLHGRGIPNVAREGRTWLPWTASDGVLVGAAVDEGVESLIAVGADVPVTLRSFHDGFKHLFDSAPIGAEATFFTAFAMERGELAARCRDLAARAGAVCAAFRAEEDARALARPAFTIPGRPVAASFLAELPSMIDALAVNGIPGGMRAAAGHYWIWGWDSMIHVKGLLFAGMDGFVADMLGFYHQRAHPETGIPHQLGADLSGTIGMAFPAQSIYNVMLYHHHCATGDLAVLRRHLPLARWIIERNLERETPGTGLVGGISVFPDHPRLLGEDADGLSAFNNSIYYQALVATASLARTLAAVDGDGGLAAFADRCEAAAMRCRAGFVRIFFDPERGTFVGSASADGLVRRPHHPSYPVLWLMPCAWDLVESVAPQVADYLERELVGPWGIYPFRPVDEDSFLGDGNQFTAYYPVTEAFARNLLARTGRRAALATWYDMVERYWATHTVPEGTTFDGVNPPTSDCPGGMQPFSGKAWLEGFYTAIAGIDLTHRGLEIGSVPVDGPAAIRNLRIGAARLDLAFAGCGRPLATTVDGVAVADPSLIPMSSLRRAAAHRVAIARGD